MRVTDSLKCQQHAETFSFLSRKKICNRQEKVPSVAEGLANLSIFCTLLEGSLILEITVVLEWSLLSLEKPVFYNYLHLIWLTDMLAKERISVFLLMPDTPRCWTVWAATRSLSSCRRSRRWGRCRRGIGWWPHTSQRRCERETVRTRPPPPWFYSRHSCFVSSPAKLYLMKKENSIEESKFYTDKENSLTAYKKWRI